MSVELLPCPFCGLSLERSRVLHPDQTSPMTVGPEAFFEQEMFAALRAEGAAEAYDDMARQHEEDAQEYNRRRDPGMANHQRKYAKAFRDKAAKTRAALSKATTP